MLEWIYINGAITTKEQALIPINDTAIGRGYGIFDFLQAREGVPLFLEDHLTRFYNSARILGIPVHYSFDDLYQSIYQLLSLNRTEAAGIKIIATGGISADGYSVGQNKIIIYLTPYAQVLKEKFKDGVNLKLIKYQREIPEVKSINYLFPMFLAPKLKSQGFEEPLYYDEWVRETARGNIFAVRNNKLITPDTGILKGVTRKQVIAAAQNVLPVEEGQLSVEDLLSADELFLTSSIKRILPVCRVDENRIGSGEPGSWTKKLAAELHYLEEVYIKEATKSAVAP